MARILCQHVTVFKDNCKQDVKWTVLHDYSEELLRVKWYGVQLFCLIGFWQDSVIDSVHHQHHHFFKLSF